MSFYDINEKQELPNARSLRATDIKRWRKIKFKCGGRNAYVSHSDSGYLVEYHNGSASSHKNLTEFKKAMREKDWEHVRSEMEKEEARNAEMLQNGVYKHGAVVGVSFVDCDGMGFSYDLHYFVSHTYRPKGTIIDIEVSTGLLTARIEWTPNSSNTKEWPNLDNVIAKVWSDDECSSFYSHINQAHPKEKTPHAPAEKQSNTKTVANNTGSTPKAVQRYEEEPKKRGFFARLFNL